MKKITIILTTLLTIICLAGCSSKSEETEARTVDATTNIVWNAKTQEINVTTVTIKCNDNYYGVVVNDSINFNNQNNYFTTGSGLTIQIKDNKDGINNGAYNYSAKIEDNAYLFVSGDDEEAVKEVFNNVFKTNKGSYQMFSHDITNEWIDDVIITSDVVSFSNGSDTTYIYQNEGSLSEGSLDGKVEPTVFKKQLRGIDIPITYPEDIDGVSNYIPYGTETYNHWTNESYTPYSAYTNYTYEEAISQTVNEDMTNFVILANNDENVINLFTDKNNHTQTLFGINYKENSGATVDIKINELSSVKEIAKSVINSENRYHFGIIDNKTDYLYQWTESNKNGYYVDGNGISNIKITGSMSGKLIAPTLKISIPTYDFEAEWKLSEYGMKEMAGGVIGDYAYAEGLGTLKKNELLTNYHFENHGANTSFKNLYTTNDINKPSEDQRHNNLYYIIEGDYIYYLSNEGKLYIFENIGTKVIAEGLEDSGWKSDGYIQTFITFVESNDITNTEMESCFAGNYNNLQQKFIIKSCINY